MVFYNNELLGVLENANVIAVHLLLEIVLDGSRVSNLFFTGIGGISGVIGFSWLYYFMELLVLSLNRGFA